MRFSRSIARTDDQPPDPPPGRRQGAQRIRILKGARVRVPGALPIRCVVRDISTTGARLEGRGPIISDFFRLSFDDLVWPQEIPCKVVWRDNDAIGVNFEAPISVPDNLLADAAD